MQPELACTVQSDTLGTIGYLAIHNRVHGRACGGVRLVPDISLEEIRCAARTMAYKSGFIGFPMGGAKAAIRADGVQEPSRHELLAAFGKAIAPLLETRAYLPATDMNSTVEDVQRILRGAGIDRALSGAMHRTPEYSAWSCFISTLAALETRGIDPREASFAVQGFGKVASEFVKLMSGAGAKLLAVSNLSGAIANMRGLDVEDLLGRWQAQGERCLEQYPQSEIVPHEHVLTFPVDVLLPAARAWAIHADNYQRIEASIIVCAANVAMDDRTEQRLGEGGTIVVPDFVANCGGLFGSVLIHQVNETTIWKILDSAYRRKISQLIARSRKSGGSISAIAGGEAEERMARWSERERTWLERGGRWLRSKAPESIRTTRHVRFYEELWATD